MAMLINRVAQAIEMFNATSSAEEVLDRVVEDWEAEGIGRGDLVAPVATEVVYDALEEGNG